jgi:hypothetical protein
LAGETQETVGWVEPSEAHRIFEKPFQRDRGVVARLLVSDVLSMGIGARRLNPSYELINDPTNLR